jgi:hypothetical protein
VLHVFGFERLAIAVADLYFVDPRPSPGQEGAERGVRVELRYVERPKPKGSIYASGPIKIGRPIWRVDFLESVDRPGTLDRAHHHPAMKRWEPDSRRFEQELTSDPLGWFAQQLKDLEPLLGANGVKSQGLESDLEQIRDSSSEIVDTIRRLLQLIGEGELAKAPAPVEEGKAVRSGWL